MKAITQDSYGSADVLELGEIDKPVVGPNDVLVRVLAAGVDPGVWHLMTGRPRQIAIEHFDARAIHGIVREDTNGHLRRIRP
ncbi:MAG: NAD(P)-dependent alcohol dehydrogenase, partial [Actinobacteria bacterium]|nr:NAD(P)-dependent alcohol dehydrogenase [Actinomycetota bacterium]